MKKNGELVAIYEVSKILASSHFQLIKLLRESLKILSLHLKLLRTVIFIKEGQNPKLLASYGIFDPQEHISFYQSFIEQIFKNGFPVVIPDLYAELYSNEEIKPNECSENPLSLFCIPIRSERECLGVLVCERKRESALDSLSETTQVLSLAANLFGQKIKLCMGGSLSQETQEKSEASFYRYKPDSLKTRNANGVIGQSKQMQAVLDLVYHVAPSRSTVLLRGESGTGKEVIARTIHYLSPRKEGPFIKVNCSALPETLLESELFGHEKGAFTGALFERKGRFELAHGGTLFLDEIGDISPAVQVKLLRVLQEREFERVGGNKTIRVDVRVITATNKNLEDAVLKGEFRADLYFRINVVSIFLPPLRERKEDIPLLAEHILNKIGRELNRKLKITPEALNLLINCHWPGNVRELENCLERAATNSKNNWIEEVDVACRRNQCSSPILWKKDLHVISTPIVSSTEETFHKEETHRPSFYSPLVSDDPKEKIIQAMEKCGWVQAKAARLLNITPRQLGYALKKYGIAIKKF
ncbi:ATPase AAA [Methylacidiphilum kamchatkense Kam1]|uniref:Nif-specific regulatory protein n=1 Tax=Methylacidiphilum kamchatkense Kam1 TaxID=1202785 RepID=A0A0C1RV96_9BACT|nr:nif-specific transcriptional activator NifA [Methylacidiphilum kamchatkense]KIE58871.1 ATPase AAA [Methylacidiphilum kamchatkense Kam1]QDQ41702.1 Nif-specific regulatory protein [Methylacidiphilum kamchatkense Kam1]